MDTKEPKNITQSSNYKDFIIKIKQEVLQTRNNTLKIVNKELVWLYFRLWKIIWEKIKNSFWWKSVVEKISQDLIKTANSVNLISIAKKQYPQNYFTL